MESEFRRNALNKSRLDLAGSRGVAATGSSSPPRRPVGASPIFSSSPPAGLLNLTARSSGSALHGKSAPSLSASGASSGSAASSQASSSSSSSSSLVSSSSVAPSPSFRSLLVRHRRKAVIAGSAGLGVYLATMDEDVCATCVWMWVGCAMLLVLWAQENLRLSKQLIACRSLTGLAVIALQHLPVVVSQVLDLAYGSAAFFAVLAIASFFVE